MRPADDILNDLENSVGKICVFINNGIDNESLELDDPKLNVFMKNYGELLEELEQCTKALPFDYDKEKGEEERAQMRNIKNKFYNMAADVKAYLGV